MNQSELQFGNSVMGKDFSFEIKHSQEKSLARVGTISTPHGDIQTPAFIPVGTKATVKSVLPESMRDLGAQALLANAYHLYLQPGPDVLDEAGGLAQFMNWNGPTFTDSGGFQVLSLGVGFKRLVIGKHFDAPWKSYKESLPTNKAMPFFIDHDNIKVPPYTEAIAMKYGWVWKIPVEGRYGCGYVYDSDLVSDEQVLEEIKEMFGPDVESPKTFEFEPGRYETPWVKNCIAIGLSAGFIEPLEATSIMTSLLSLGSFIPNNLGNMLKDDFYIQRYNRFVTSVHDDTFNFVFLHYLTKREDTEFWTSFKDRPTPDAIEKFLEECKHTIPDKRFLTSISSIYGVASWFSVSKGLRIFNRDKASNLYSGILSDIRREDVQNLSSSFYTNMEITLKGLPDHGELLNVMRQN